MRQAVLYFANWNLNRRPARKGEVCALPWDCATYLNHAFWVLEPAEGTHEPSFARRAGKKPARTDWRIVSLHPECDTEDLAPSALEPELPRSHFAQYAVMHKRCPSVKILLSIGGWTRCGCFFRDGVYKGGPRKLYCPLPCASAPVWDTLAQEDLLELLQTPGWHSAYDARAGGAYLVYDGPDNPFDRWFLSVETARSLGQKLDLIRNAELAGIIVWEASLDTKNHSFAAQLRDTLLR